MSVLLTPDTTSRPSGRIPATPGGPSLETVFSMGHARGFNDQTLESLDSSKPEVQYHAVCAAGNWGVEAARPYIAGLIDEAVGGKDERLR